jgi:hypothetical protein
MSSTPLTQYAVDELVRAKKVVQKIRNAGRGNEPLIVDLCRADQSSKDMSIRLEGHRPTKSLSGIPDIRRPSASLIWRNQRIRGIDWTIKHEVVRNGIPTGESIRGWHEHYWTDEDRPHSIRVPRPPPKNEDLSALIEWCCKQWNIDGVEESMRLFP